LPHALRSHPITNDNVPLQLVLSINCLLYADDVALIATENTLQSLLNVCEQHSLEIGYRWNPAKCVILTTPDDPINYTLYDQSIDKQDTFFYLGIPFKPNGVLAPLELVRHNTTKAEKTLQLLSSIGLNSSGFSKLLASRLYQQIIRPQMEYGLAILKLTNSHYGILESIQNKALRRIYGGSDTVSTKVMRHLARNPTMKERSHIL
jgi:hypothetical protein